CQNCRPHAFKVWTNSLHANAYQKLVAAKNPSNREFDGECVKCHTVGFDYVSGFRDMQQTAFLKDVGCESCHGPCSEHIQRPNDKAIHKLINEYKYLAVPPAQRLQAIDSACQKCHDLDNDVHWDFKKNWPLIEHMNK